MTVNVAESVNPPSNPLDIVEEIVGANEWAFERANEDELVVEITGRFCDYRLFFIWRQDLSALHFTCVFDARVAGTRRGEVHELLARVNEKLWLGHFDLCQEDGVPMYRHTILLRGARGASVEQLEDLVDVALNECERFYPAFQYVVWGGKRASDALSAALFDTVGEA